MTTAPCDSASAQRPSKCSATQQAPGNPGSDPVFGGEILKGLPAPPEGYPGRGTPQETLHPDRADDRGGGPVV